jgi:hypothetical protein
MPKKQPIGRLLVKVIPLALDWLVRVMERILVLAIAFVACYVGWQIVLGHQMSDVERHGLAKAAENWRIVLVLLVPILYLTIRTFIEEVVEAFGMKREHRTRHRKQPPNDVGEEQR